MWKGVTLYVIISSEIHFKDNINLTFILGLTDVGKYQVEGGYGVCLSTYGPTLGHDHDSSYDTSTD